MKEWLKGRRDMRLLLVGWTAAEDDGVVGDDLAAWVFDGRDFVDVGAGGELGHALFNLSADLGVCVGVVKVFSADLEEEAAEWCRVGRRRG